MTQRYTGLYSTKGIIYYLDRIDSWNHPSHHTRFTIQKSDSCGGRGRDGMHSYPVLREWIDLNGTSWKVKERKPKFFTNVSMLRGDFPPTLIARLISYTAQRIE